MAARQRLGVGIIGAGNISSQYLKAMRDFPVLDIRAIAPDDEAFAWGLLEAEKLAVMPGSSFGEAAAGHVRISLCQPEPVLVDAAARLRRHLATLALRSAAE